MFIDDKSTIEVVVYYKLNKNKNGVRVESDLREVAEKDRSKFEKLTVFMRPTNWKIYNDLLRAAKIENIRTGVEETDWQSYKEKKMVSLISGWDAKDKDGKPVPVNVENIMHLHPIIAESILVSYDRLIYVQDEDLEDDKEPIASVIVSPLVSSKVAKVGVQEPQPDAIKKDSAQKSEQKTDEQKPGEGTKLPETK